MLLIHDMIVVIYVDNLHHTILNHDAQHFSRGHTNTYFLMQLSHFMPLPGCRVCSPCWASSGEETRGRTVATCFGGNINYVRGRNKILSGIFCGLCHGDMCIHIYIYINTVYMYVKVHIYVYTLVSSEPRSKPLCSCQARGPLARVWRKQNLCARKQNVSNGVNISFFGARM